MKKLMIGMMATNLVGTLFLSNVGTMNAASDIRVTVNKTTVQFPDQKPIMNDNRVLIPTRFVAQSLGGTVGYSNAAKKVTIKQGSKTITLVMNSSNVIVNGKNMTLDVPAKSINGRIMVPLRFVSEAMGANVDWNQSQNLVSITTGSGGGDGGVTPTNPPTNTDTSRDFAFDNFNTMAKSLFKNNLKEVNNKVTFTVPSGATATFFGDRGKMTDLKAGKTYTYDVGKGNGFIGINYIDPSKVVDKAPKQSEDYTIFLDASMYSPQSGSNNYSTNKAIIVNKIVINGKMYDKVGTVNEVVSLAKSL